MNRKWSCNRTLHGYLIQLSYGDIHTHVLVSDYDIGKSLDVNKFIEYQIIRLNQGLKEAMFPLARNLEAQHIQRRYP